MRTVSARFSGFFARDFIDARLLAMFKTMRELLTDRLCDRHGHSVTELTHRGCSLVRQHEVARKALELSALTDT